MKDRPIITDANGTRRFQENRVVRHLLDEATAGRKCDLNVLWQIVQCHHQGDRKWMADFREFYQMIGYSLGGYGEIFPHTKERE